MTTEETQVCFFVCADRPLPMTSDQDDFTPSAFPLVLAEASIGEGAQRRSAVPISKTGLSSVPTPIGSRQASRGHVPESNPANPRLSYSSPTVLFCYWSCSGAEDIWPLLQVEPSAV